MRPLAPFTFLLSAAIVAMPSAVFSPAGAVTPWHQTVTISAAGTTVTTAPAPAPAPAPASTSTITTTVVTIIPAPTPSPPTTDPGGVELARAKFWFEFLAALAAILGFFAGGVTWC